MHIERFRGGVDRNFSYLIIDEQERKAVIIDPFKDISIYTERAQELKVKIVAVLNTHGHYDHTEGNESCIEAGMSLLPNEGIQMCGSVEIEVIPTPGHTLDSVCFLVEDALFTGDTLFVGKIGGTTNEERAQLQWESLQKLMQLPDDIIIYPGHDVGVTPSSTMGAEKKTNPFLRRKTVEDFLDLKKNWKAYKEQHGIK